MTKCYFKYGLLLVVRIHLEMPQYFFQQSFCTELNIWVWYYVNFEMKFLSLPVRFLKGLKVERKHLHIYTVFALSIDSILVKLI